MRSFERGVDGIRPVEIIRNFQPNADSSVLIKMGNTHVLCAVSIEERIPSFLEGKGQGWITSEYGILPGATGSRYRREAVSGISGRTHEIQRLIGRSLRMMVDLHDLGERTLRIDCDVLNADGGTRTAAITGAAIALRNALGAMANDGRLDRLPDLLPVAAISVGVVDGEVLLDLDYSEDSRAEVDGNFVMTADGRFIESQCTAEGAPFDRATFDIMANFAEKGIRQLFDLW